MVLILKQDHGSQDGNGDLTRGHSTSRRIHASAASVIKPSLHRVTTNCHKIIPSGNTSSTRQTQTFRIWLSVRAGSLGLIFWKKKKNPQKKPPLILCIRWTLTLSSCVHPIGWQLVDPHDSWPWHEKLVAEDQWSNDTLESSTKWLTVLQTFSVAFSGKKNSVAVDLTENNSAMTQVMVMVWCQTGDKGLTHRSQKTHICVSNAYLHQ